MAREWLAGWAVWAMLLAVATSTKYVGTNLACSQCKSYFCRPVCIWHTSPVYLCTTTTTTTTLPTEAIYSTTSHLSRCAYAGWVGGGGGEGKMWTAEKRSFHRMNNDDETPDLSVLQQQNRLEKGLFWAHM